MADRSWGDQEVGGGVGGGGGAGGPPKKSPLTD